MPKRTGVDMPQEAHAQMLAALRRARYGDVLALHMVLWCAAGRTPTDIAAVLCCSRSSVYRTVRAYRAGTRGLVPDDDGRLSPPARTTVLVPTRRRSLRALLKAPPPADDWCRTRWSCATLAATFKATRGLTVSAETMRRWVHEVGWVWKRATLVANDDDPHRVERLARIRFVYEPLQRWEARVFADELALHLLPKVGYAWMPPGTQGEVMTPGTNAKHYLAGARDLSAGTLHHGVGPRKTHGRCRALLHTLEAADPAAQDQRIDVVVDNSTIHKAKAVEAWFATHPRIRLLLLPTSCPRAHPIERAFGDVHDLCPRNHKRTRWRDLLADVVEHRHVNGPWPYKLSERYDVPAVPVAVERMVMANTLAAAG